MTVVNPPAWLQAGSYPARTDRLVTDALVDIPGIVSVGDLAVSQNTSPGMSVRVAKGRAWIRGTTVTDQGMYNFFNDGPVTLSVTTSHATLPRIDRVVAQIEDSEYAGVSDVASVKVLAGTAASTPVAPAVPDSAISLATISVPAASTAVTTAQITNSATVARLYASMTPQTLSVTSGTRPIGTNRFTGMGIYETDTGREWKWNGTEWQFRGGPGPRAFVSRGGAWAMATTASYISTLDAATGSNFETAYFTFVDSSSSSTGDRIRVKQAGWYNIEMFVNMSNFSVDYFADLRTEVVTGSTGLPSGSDTNAPRASGQFVKGRHIGNYSRTIYLPTGAELAWRYDAGTPSIQVAEFWAMVTLIG